LLGPNGAGKSTFIRMAMDILRPDSGRILVSGRPSTDADHDRVGYLPEERGLYRKQKVIDVLDYFGRLKGMKGPGVKQKAQKALDAVGLGAWAKKRVDALSKGMQQKVQLVGTLLHEPDLVVLDEPFSGLDPLNARMVKDMILTLKREGRLVVLSTHQMDQVEELCDRIVMIDRGKRVLYGTVREIKKTYTEEIRNATGRGNVVVIDGEGAFASMPGVLASEAVGGAHRLTLDPALKPETFLQAALASGCTVARFEAAPAPLEEIFVHVASKGEAALA
jgi:ABC-2 type transport system ATP-binding protein